MCIGIGGPVDGFWWVKNNMPLNIAVIAPYPRSCRLHQPRPPPCSQLSPPPLPRAPPPADAPPLPAPASQPRPPGYPSSPRTCPASQRSTHAARPNLEACLPSYPPARNLPQTHRPSWHHRRIPAAGIARRSSPVSEQRTRHTRGQLQQRRGLRRLRNIAEKTAARNCRCVSAVQADAVGSRPRLDLVPHLLVAILLVTIVRCRRRPWPAGARVHLQVQLT